MASAVEADGTVPDTTRDFLRSFSVTGYGDSDSDSDFAELSPIPETPGGEIEDEVDQGLRPGKNNNAIEPMEIEF